MKFQSKSLPVDSGRPPGNVPPMQSGYVIKHHNYIAPGHVTSSNKKRGGATI